MSPRAIALLLVALALFAASARAGGTGKTAFLEKEGLTSAELAFPLSPLHVMSQLRKGKSLKLKVVKLPSDFSEADARKFRVYLFPEKYIIGYIENSRGKRASKENLFYLEEAQKVVTTSIDKRDNTATFAAIKLKKKVEFGALYIAMICAWTEGKENMVTCNPSSAVTVATTDSTDPDPQLSRFIKMTPDQYFKEHPDTNVAGAYDVFEDILISELKERHWNSLKYLDLLDSDVQCSGIAEKYFGFVDMGMSRLDSAEGIVLARCGNAIEKLSKALMHPCYKDVVNNHDQLDVFMKGWHSCSRVHDVFGVLHGELLKAMWRNVLYPGWHTTVPMSFSWEKEGKDLAILNEYRPGYVDSVLYRELCQQGKDSEKSLISKYTTRGLSEVKGDRTFQKEGSCVPSWWDEMCGALPCKHHFFKNVEGGDVVVKEVLDFNPKGAYTETSSHPLLLLHMCVHFKKPADAFECVERLVRRLLTGDQGARIVSGLNTMYAKHIVDQCLHSLDSDGARDFVATNEIEPMVMPEFAAACVKPLLRSAFAEFKLDGKEVVHPIESEEAMERFIRSEVVEMVTNELSKIKTKGIDNVHEHELVARWTDYVRADDSNYFLSKTLDQELAQSTWEMKHDKCEGVIGMAMLQILRMQRSLGNTKNLHFHIVFERPESSCCDGGTEVNRCSESCHYEDAFEQEEGKKLWEDNEGLAALATHMNDYAAFRAYGANVHTKFLSVFDTEEVRDLKQILALGGRRLHSIETMTDGHNWGAFKEAFVALRAGIYNKDNLVGFEIRGGISPLFTKNQLKLKGDDRPSEYYYTLTNLIRLIHQFPVTDPGRLRVQLNPHENMHRHRWLRSISQEDSDGEDEIDEAYPMSTRFRDSDYDSLEADDPLKPAISKPKPVITLKDISEFQENGRHVGYEYFGTSAPDGEYCRGGCIELMGLSYPREMVEFAMKIAVDRKINWQRTSVPKACSDLTGDRILGLDFLSAPENVGRDRMVSNCILGMFTRWSFVMLNLQSWAKLLYQVESTEELSNLKFTLLGAEHSYAEADRSFIVEKFFREPAVMACGLKEEDPAAGHSCYEYLSSFISHLDTQEYLRTKF